MIPIERNPEFELILLKSGIHSLRSSDFGETFHPGVGPQVEAHILYVQQQKLVERCPLADPFVIWDVGLGAAANSLTAIEALSHFKNRIEIHSFDKTTAPLEFALKNAEKLEYIFRHQEKLNTLLKDKQVQVSPNITWTLHLGDFQHDLKNLKLASPHSIFYDPYSPKSNPEMWTLNHFQELYRHLDPNVPCIFTNYTRSTPVRAALLLAGFSVGIGTAIGIKSETTIASNQLNLLESPLDQNWINRVRHSTNSAPLKENKYTMSLISGDDFLKIQNLDQFRA